MRPTPLCPIDRHRSTDNHIAYNVIAITLAPYPSGKEELRDLRVKGASEVERHLQDDSIQGGRLTRGTVIVELMNDTQLAIGPALPLRGQFRMLHFFSVHVPDSHIHIGEAHHELFKLRLVDDHFGSKELRVGVVNIQVIDPVTRAPSCVNRVDEPHQAGVTVFKSLQKSFQRVLHDLCTTVKRPWSQYAATRQLHLGRNGYRMMLLQIGFPLIVSVLYCCTICLHVHMHMHFHVLLYMYFLMISLLFFNRY